MKKQSKKQEQERFEERFNVMHDMAYRFNGEILDHKKPILSFYDQAEIFAIALADHLQNVKHFHGEELFRGVLETFAESFTFWLKEALKKQEMPNVDKMIDDLIVKDIEEHKKLLNENPSEEDAKRYHSNINALVQMRAPSKWH
jgi:hypothetical protein